MKIHRLSLTLLVQEQIKKKTKKNKVEPKLHWF